MASDVKWIKITTDIFDDEKILLIESLPDAYAIITVWFKLLCLAGKQNNSGVFLMGRVAYTDKMLATIFRMKEATVTMAIQTFEQFGMVEIVDGVITIPNWGKHQNLDQLESKKEYMRNYMREYRGKQKAIAAGKPNSKTNSEANVSEADKERDIEGNIEGKKESDSSMVSKDTICRTDVRRIIQAWNSLGLGQIVKMAPDTNRYAMLKKRIKDYGVDTVLTAVEKVRESAWLNGKNKDGWTITFDWFIRPNNFPKVLDGNYDNRTSTAQQTQAFGQPYQRQTKADELEDFYAMANAWASERGNE